TFVRKDANNASHSNGGPRNVRVPAPPGVQKNATTARAASQSRNLGSTSQTLRRFCVRFANYRPNGSEPSDWRRHVPERPPVFSQSCSSPIVIERSIDLHMS